MRSERIIACWAMGLTQHKNAVATIQEVVNLLLLRGSIGKPGAGVCPVRGHSNVQGDRTMGIWERPRKEFLDRLQEVFDFEPPREHGFDTVEAIKAMHAGGPKVFFALGGNFLSATPDTDLHRRRPAPLPADRASFDQAQSRASRHRPAGADSALPGPHGERRAGRRAAVRDQRELDGRRADDRKGGLRPPSDRALERAGDRLPPGPRDARPAEPRRLGVPGRRLRPHPRPHRPRHPRLRRLQRAGAPAGRLLSAQSGPRRRFSRQPRARPASPFIPCPSYRLEPGQLVDDDRPHRTTSSTRRFTAWTTAIAASTTSAASC